MTPDERQLLSGLFDRIRNSSSQPRDREADTFITDAVRAQPYAPYLLAQTVIVQEQALRAANERLQELEAKARQQPDQQGGDTSFLGSLGRSIFGGGNEQPRQGAPGSPQQGGYAPPAGNPQAYSGQQGYAPQQGYAQQPSQGPWGQAAQPQAGGFLKGALGAAAGVAGGVLLANSISGLFRGSNPYGIASGMPGFGGFPGGGGETIVNNYYENDGAPGGDFGPNGGDFGPNDGGNFDPSADFGPDDGSFGSDDSYNT